MFSSVQSLSHVWPFATPWTAAHQASLSITNSQSLLRLTSIVSVMPSSHLILCHPLLLLPSIFPSSGSFPMSQFFASGGQGIGVTASASVLPKNIQNWFLLGLAGWISLQSKGHIRVFSNITVLKHQFFDRSLPFFSLQPLPSSSQQCYVEFFSCFECLPSDFPTSQRKNCFQTVKMIRLGPPE